MYEDRSSTVWSTFLCGTLRQLGGDPRAVGGYAFSPDGGHLAWIAKDGALHLTNIVTGEDVALPFVWDNNPPSKIVYSPDGRKVAAAGHSTVRLWDLAHAKEIHIEANVRSARVNLLHFVSKDTLRAISEDGVWIDWNTVSGKIASEEHSERNASDRLDNQLGLIARFVVFSADHRRHAEKDSIGDVTIFGSGRKKVADLPDTYDVIYVDFSPDATRLASASFIAPVRLWDVDSETEMVRYYSGDSLMVKVKVSPDGKILAAQGTTGAIWIWDAYLSVSDLVTSAQALRPECLHRNQREKLRLLSVRPSSYEKQYRGLCRSYKLREWTDLILDRSKAGTE
jgi:WD40 repeat protein